MRTRDVDIAILFEKAAREIDVACALKVMLELRHGITTEIVQQNYPDSSVLRDLRPSVVVLPFCYQQRSNNAYFVRWRDATYFNLTWEQLFYPGNAKAKTPRGEFATKHVIHNAWGDAYAEVLRAQGVPDEHIFVSGNPAYALYDEPYRGFFRSRIEIAQDHGLDMAKRWIFFPENYNWAFYEQGMLDQMIVDGQPAEQVATMRQAVTTSFEIAMDWCVGLARRGDVELIVRPRPATPLDVFVRRVEGVVGSLPPRFSITQADTVRDWILASDIVISSYSTSLIEASVAGKPGYLIEPVPWPAPLRQAWHSLVPRITSQAELMAATGSIDGDETLARWARETMLGRGDPIQLVADQLALIRHRSVPVPSRSSWQSISLPNTRHLPARVMFELRSHVRPWLPMRREVAPDSRDDVAAVSEIPARLQRWSEVLGAVGPRVIPGTDDKSIPLGASGSHP